MKATGKWRQRIFYGATDMAGNFIWQIVGLYLLYYYTSVLGLTAAFVGTLFMVVRFIDAFDGMFFGFLIDHTNTKHGQARPYFIWFGIPLGVLSAALFINPTFAGNKVFEMVWVSVIYTLFSLTYSGANTPITAILPNLSKDPGERANLASARLVMTNIGATLMGAATLPMVKWLGGSNTSRTGWQLWGIIVGIGIAVLFTLAFLNLHEQVPKAATTEPGKQKLSIGQSLKGAAANRPWVILSVSCILVQTFWVVRMTTEIYYLQFIYNRVDLTSLFVSLNIIAVIGNVLVPILSRRFQNRHIMAGALVLMIVGEGVLPLGVKTQSLVILFGGNILSMIAMSIIFTIIFVMVSDTVEYSRLRLGINEPGFLSSVPMVGAKLGMGLGGGIAGWVLSFGGFASKAKIQSAGAMHAINLDFVWLPIILAFVIIILLQFYHLNEKKLPNAESVGEEVTSVTTAVTGEEMEG
ncbi:MFS transporter [Furfurilactobacillus entadae]|uniref:MFS transporter n=1 Tax=Furfurilactobacillus entadae TaxID=2922307 RepID=UPI0035E89521